MVLVVPLENLNALAWTLFSISTVLTFGRFYIRWQKEKSLHLDDVFNALALGSLLAFAITYQVYLPIQYNYQLYALGLGGYLPSDDQLMYAQNVGIVNIVFFWWALFSISNAFRKWWIAVAIYTGISFLATFFVIFWSCKTPSQLEDLEACNTISEELIIGLETLWCVFNTVGDILTMTLPFGMLRAMHAHISETRCGSYRRPSDHQHTFRRPPNHLHRRKLYKLIPQCQCSLGSLQTHHSRNGMRTAPLSNITFSKKDRSFDFIPGDAWNEEYSEN
ncbi:uncharacterized protein EAE97_011122 [Botrytis byssoidea]|uniref:Uncharacterized protein n=1 Tax=Botrytis byssoidea TaxID=139641 RepID=A0A9P5LLI4_9HELO|nr:uncharacterized protein EAE97_011122 [Botrytis byssoidea]KAF7922380.1 hypothetical protein EAE97_011122 [Botrytis byssoidea]